MAALEVVGSEKSSSSPKTFAQAVFATYDIQLPLKVIIGDMVRVKIS